MSKFTPGKWTIAEDDPTFVYALWEPRGSNRMHCAMGKGSSYGSQEEQIANARLIACAPEMYEALKAIAGRFDATDCDEIFRAHELLARIEGAK